jgi:hypothetical protein
MRKRGFPRRLLGEKKLIDRFFCFVVQPFYSSPISFVDAKGNLQYLPY